MNTPQLTDDCQNKERGSADVMNEGFHEGLDSGQMYQN